MAISFQFPNLTNVAKGTAVHLAFKYGMQTADPFEVPGAIGSQGDPNLGVIEGLLGQPKLTSLAMKFGASEMIIDECILTVVQEKNIVSTPLQGKNGTIKEFISKGDYNITAELAVSNYQKSESSDQDDQSSFQYPKEALEELIKLINVDETIIVDSDFLRVFGIGSAVVQSYNLQQETHSNRQSLQIQMLSDESYEIKIAKNQDA